MSEAYDDLRYNLAERAFTAPDADDDVMLASLDARIRDALSEADALRYLLYYGWTIICNAGGGDWTKESQEWQGAAERFREQFHAMLDRSGPGAQVSETSATEGE